MWPLPTIRNEQITIAISPTHIALGWINSSAKYPLILNAYQSQLVEVASAMVINQHVQHFVKKYDLKHSRVRIAIAAPLIFEQFIRLSKASPSASDFAIPALKKMVWDFRYIHTLDTGDHLFYVCGINRADLFAQQLLAHACSGYLSTVTSFYMALAQAYRALFGPAFRQSHMALDMLKHNYSLHDCMSTDSVARLLQVAPAANITIGDHKESLLAMIGLCYQERERI